jgi:type VI secretion system protein ImpL
MSRHLDALLALGPVVSPLEQDKALVEATRLRLASVPLPQRVYNRLRQSGLGAQFPEFTIVRAGGPNAQLVFTRAGGRPCRAASRACSPTTATTRASSPRWAR